MATKKDAAETISVLEINRETVDFHILGKTPLIMNSMSEKARMEILLPSKKKNTAEKESTLKHEPLIEYRNSVYRTSDDSPAALGILPTAFKGAIGSAALDTPGATKTQILRLIYVEGAMIDVFGIPALFMAVTRSADIKKTPDVRTRAILAEWACTLSITYPVPVLKKQAVVNLLAAAGFLSGVGDWRQSKGSGNYGAFSIVAPDDPNYVRIKKTQGRKAQLAALESPSPHDAETAKLLSWYSAETKRRGFEVAA